MAQVEVNIDKDSVNDSVISAILDSVVGEAMKEEIAKAVKGNSYGSHTSVIHSAVARVVQDAAFKILREEYATEIDTLIRQKINEDDLVDKAVKSMLVKVSGS